MDADREPAPVELDVDLEKIQILDGHSADLRSAAFQIEKEDHTLGNALTYIILKNPLVEFCGYTMPHPAEARMILRIQTKEGYTAVDALLKGLDDLCDLCDHVGATFSDRLQSFSASPMAIDQ